MWSFIKSIFTREFWRDWSHGKRWAMGILGTLIVASVIGIVKMIPPLFPCGGPCPKPLEGELVIIQHTQDALEPAVVVSNMVDELGGAFIMQVTEGTAASPVAFNIDYFRQDLGPRVVWLATELQENSEFIFFAREYTNNPTEFADLTVSPTIKISNHIE